MLAIILDMLEVSEYYGLTDEIEIAKGKNKLCTNWKQAWEQRKRRKAWQRK
jgi:hypothetical protein